MSTALFDAPCCVRLRELRKWHTDALRMDPDCEMCWMLASMIHLAAQKVIFRIKKLTRVAALRADIATQRMKVESYRRLRDRCESNAMDCLSTIRHLDREVMDLEREMEKL